MQKDEERMLADTQVLLFTEKELEVKEPMANRLEAMEKDHKDTMNTLTTSLKALNDMMTSAFCIVATVLAAKANPT